MPSLVCPAVAFGNNIEKVSKRIAVKPLARRWQRFDISSVMAFRCREGKTQLH